MREEKHTSKYNDLLKLYEDKGRDLLQQDENRQTLTQTCSNGMKTDRRRDRQTDRHTDRQIHRQTDRQTEKQSTPTKKLKDKVRLTDLW